MCLSLGILSGLLLCPLDFPPWTLMFRLDFLGKALALEFHLRGLDLAEALLSVLVL